MFSIGDKVVYPMHGAGVISNIEEKQVLGESRAYYILSIPYGNMQVMVPVNNADQAGLREISGEDMVDKVIAVLGAESTPMDENWNRRSRDNMEKLKTGDPCTVAEVIRNLARIEREKKLSTGEKKLLSNAKQVLASEIVLIKNVDEAAAMDMIDNAI
ncbi:MAG: CarD family transcriptional regulator [Clostridia bacterium]|nr:CarD family transcriptional regulator [Clostridia bacterium]